MKLLAGLLKPSSGNIEFASKRLEKYHPRELARLVSYLPQEDEIHFPFTVGEITMLGRWPHSGGAFFDSKSDLEAAARAMEMVGISAWKDRIVSELSGGERARVMLAKAIASDPKCMLLDEPMSELDLKYRSESFQLLRKIVDSEVGIVVVAHDIGSVSRWADRFVLLADGKIQVDGKADEVLDRQVLEKAYGTRIKVLSDGIDRAVFAETDREGTG